VGPYKFCRATIADDDEMRKMEGGATLFIIFVKGMRCADNEKFEAKKGEGTIRIQVG